MNFAGSSSSPKGFRFGALETYWRLVYSSKISGLLEISGVMGRYELSTYVSPLWEETNFKRAKPKSRRTVEWCVRHSVSSS